MTILNPDGTPYKLTGSIEQFDPNDPEHELFNLWDQEAIRQGGSPILYYEVIISPQDVDPQYLEARNKRFSQFPVSLYCSYDPKNAQNLVNAFGIDAPDELEIEFNYRDVLQKVGHPPKIGSRLYTPHLRENWVIIQRNLGEFKMWGALRLTIIAQRFQESTTTGEGKVTQKNPTPKYKII
jgi:hypothetical protein